MVAPCPDTSTLLVNACFEARFNEADAILNRYYHAALKRARQESGGATAQRFIQAERSWVAYRDAECRSVAAREVVPAFLETAGKREFEGIKQLHGKALPIPVGRGPDGKPLLI